MNRNDKIVDENYLDHVRSLACIVPTCGFRPVDPHHLKAVGWREAKRNDYSTVPLCRRHHSEVEQIGMEKFCAKYSIDDLWKDAFYQLCDYLVQQRVEA